MRNSGWKRERWAAYLGVRRGVYRLYYHFCTMTPMGFGANHVEDEKCSAGIVPERKPSSGSQDYLRKVIARYINSPRTSQARSNTKSLPLLLPPFHPHDRRHRPHSCPQRPPPLLPSSRQTSKASRSPPPPGNSHHQPRLPPTSLP